MFIVVRNQRGVMHGSCHYSRATAATRKRFIAGAEALLVHFRIAVYD